MAKKPKKDVKLTMKLVVAAGQATMAPPLGPALSPTGINTMDFINRFNEETKEGQGILTPVIITIFGDRSFDLEYKTPPTSELIRRELKIKKGSGVPNLKKVGKLSKEAVLRIIEVKKPDLNTVEEEQAYKTISGTAMQMGIEVEPYK